MNTLSDFGREFRKIRVDKGVSLKALSENLGYTSSYLSAIEYGKASVPLDFLDKFEGIYGLTEEQREKLESLIKKPKTKIRIEIKFDTDEKMRTVQSFLKITDSLSTEEDFKVFRRYLQNFSNKLDKMDLNDLDELK